MNLREIEENDNLYIKYYIKRSIIDNKKVERYKKYEMFDRIITKTIDDGLYYVKHVRYNYNFKDIFDMAILRLSLYENSFRRVFPSISMFLVKLVRYQKHIKKKLWSPGGKLYDKLRNVTLVGI